MDLNCPSAGLNDFLWLSPRHSQPLSEGRDYDGHVQPLFNLITEAVDLLAIRAYSSLLYGGNKIIKSLN